MTANTELSLEGHKRLRSIEHVPELFGYDRITAELDDRKLIRWEGVSGYGYIASELGLEYLKAHQASSASTEAA